MLPGLGFMVSGARVSHAQYNQRGPDGYKRIKVRRHRANRRPGVPLLPCLGFRVQVLSSLLCPCGVRGSTLCQRSGTWPFGWPLLIPALISLLSGSRGRSESSGSLYYPASRLSLPVAYTRDGQDRAVLEANARSCQGLRPSSLFPDEAAAFSCHRLLCTGFLQLWHLLGSSRSTACRM